ncbi:hypothetical protein ATSB10_23590 [Dyella thiooxydans]|uniref:Asparagine synthetase domain-containing protein n=1 Tax=Dyella thiooxydans TaxID=445710 RepID=A0A160N1T7_9GAMM|nr:hypothetical protein ATSB10_23590 [Dyella thiooxydans]
MQGEYRGGVGALDEVSVADLLRNGFVYPPHSVYRDVKVAFTGFAPGQDLHAAPRFHLPYQSASVPDRPMIGAVDTDALVATYHRLLGDGVVRAVRGMDSPWLLQSGGKDSTSLAMAVAERSPVTVCVTYAGGDEEDELESAQSVARQLGLRHTSLICDPARAYDRYLAMVPAMPLLTADFAMLSYCDLVTHVAEAGGDGLLDGLGSDTYFGLPVSWRGRLLAAAACRLRLAPALFESRLVRSSFPLAYVLGTLQMDGFERFYPGSRFTDIEVDTLFGRPIADCSRQRLELFRADISAAASAEARRRISVTVIEPAVFGKGIYVAAAAGLRLAYPYCDEALRDWVMHAVPDELLIGPGQTNKMLVRRHIAQRFGQLPYVNTKGSFRFDIRGLARRRFDQVYAFAQQARDVLPGAPQWLERHRSRMDNKYFASKFYLLAIILPWLAGLRHDASGSGGPPA